EGVTLSTISVEVMPAPASIETDSTTVVEPLLSAMNHPTAPPAPPASSARSSAPATRRPRPRPGGPAGRPRGECPGGGPAGTAPGCQACVGSPGAAVCGAVACWEGWMRWVWWPNWPGAEKPARGSGAGCGVCVGPGCRGCSGRWGSAGEADGAPEEAGAAGGAGSGRSGSGSAPAGGVARALSELCSGPSSGREWFSALLMHAACSPGLSLRCENALKPFKDPNEARGGAHTGPSRTVKTVPSPRADWTETVPPWDLTMAATMARPSPEPGWLAA